MRVLWWLVTMLAWLTPRDCLHLSLRWAVVGMRESLPLEDRIPFSCKTLNPLSNLSILLRSKLFVMLAITVALNVRHVASVLLRASLPASHARLHWVVRHRPLAPTACVTS